MVTPPPPPPPSPPGQPPVLVGAGDIADCAGPGDEATAALLDKTPGTVFTVGDNAYPNGTSTDFANCYEPGWGRHKARTRPAAGNHEYYTPGAKAYFDYFGAAAGDPAKGYYGYDLGTWRIIVLNSECSEVGGCQQGSPQEQWLRRELEANAAKNVLAYWHRPRFNCGTHPSDASMDAFWQALYGHGADVVLAGHDHSYQRFAPQDPSGKADNQYGVRQFVVGTGGRSHYASCAMPNTEVHNGDTYGLLKLTLDTSSYSWEFLPEAGRTFTDRGSSPTHAPPPPLRQVRFAAGADAGTEASSADTNYGTAITMRADDDPGAHSYLRFSVEGLPAPVAKAHVRVYTVAGDETRDGPALYAADANWSETELTWNTRPATTGGVLGDVGAVAGESWVDYDVTSLVTANATYGFALAPTSPDGITFSTREGTRPPELVVTLAQSGG